MEDTKSKRNAIMMFGGLFAGLALTLGMILREVPDEQDHQAVVAALTPANPPPYERTFPTDDDQYEYAPSDVEATLDEPAEVIVEEPAVITSDKGN